MTNSTAGRAAMSVRRRERRWLSSRPVWAESSTPRSLSRRGALSAISLSLAVGAFALPMIAAEPDSESPAAERELQVGVSNDEFQQEFDRRVGQKLRPIDVTTTVERGRLILSWIWDRRDGPEWKLRANMTREEIQREVTASDLEGFRLVHLAACAAGGEDRFSAVWEKASGPQMSIKYGVPVGEVEMLAESLAEEGQRPVRIAAASFDRRVEFTGLWEKTDEPPRELEFDLSDRQLQRAMRTRTAKGFRPIQICGYVSNRRVRFACIWEKSAGPPREIVTALTEANLQRVRQRRARDGFQPIQIHSYTPAARALYAVIWEKSGEDP